MLKAPRETPALKGNKVNGGCKAQRGRTASPELPALLVLTARTAATTSPLLTLLVI